MPTTESMSAKINKLKQSIANLEAKQSKNASSKLGKRTAVPMDISLGSSTCANKTADKNRPFESTYIPPLIARM